MDTSISENSVVNQKFEFHIGFSGDISDLPEVLALSDWKRLEFGMVVRANEATPYTAHDVEGGVQLIYTRHADTKAELSALLSQASPSLLAHPSCRAEIEQSLSVDVPTPDEEIESLDDIKIPDGIAFVSEFPTWESHISVRMISGKLFAEDGIHRLLAHLHVKFDEWALTKDHAKLIITFFHTEQQPMLSQTREFARAILTDLGGDAVLKISCERVLGCYATSAVAQQHLPCLEAVS